MSQTSVLDCQLLILSASFPCFLGPDKRTVFLPLPEELKISLYTSIIISNIFNKEFSLSFALQQTDMSAQFEALDIALLSCGEDGWMNHLLEEWGNRGEWIRIQEDG